jgi:ribosomal protein S18 acetylase RimI-like enzyme
VTSPPNGLTFATPHGLNEQLRAGIARLEATCVAHDGGRLKLEWGLLQQRATDECNDVLVLQGDRVIGFLGRYSFGGVTPELAGMVEPAMRGRGVGAALLAHGLELCRSRGDSSVLVIVPRSSLAGAALIEKFGGHYESSEHALRLAALRTARGGELPVFRRAGPGDEVAMQTLMRDGFHRDDIPVRFSEGETTWLGYLGDEPMATLRVTTDDDGSRGVYGFVVASAYRGRGIGRTLLQHVCAQALREGAPSVHLEVATENATALELYTSVGFEPVITEDYYRVALGGE